MPLTKTIIYTEAGERKVQTWDIKGSRNGSGLTPRETPEQQAEVMALYRSEGVTVVGSSISEIN